MNRTAMPTNCPTRALPGRSPGRAGLRSLIAARHSAIVLDPGAGGTRICQLLRRGARTAIRDLLRVGLPLPAPAPESAAESAADDGLGDLVRRMPRLVRQGRFSGVEVGLVVPIGLVRFHSLNITEAGLRQHPEVVQQALKFEIAREQRTDAVEVEVRYWRLPPGQSLRHNIMAVALSGVLARRWSRAFASAGLRLKQLCVAPCAHVRLAARIWPPDARDLWGIIDLGAKQTTLTAVVGDVIAYVRALTGAADQWTRRLSEGLDVSLADAERIKRAHGVAQAVSPTPNAHAATEDPASVVFGLLRDRLEALAQEVERCFSYVLNHYAALTPARLVLTGGAAVTPGLADYLSQRLSVAVMTLGNGETGDFPTDAAAAIGGALLDLEGA